MGWSRTGGGGSSFTGYTKVANFAALPAAADHTGELYIVLATTGVPFVTYRKKGFYYSDGATWTVVEDISGIETLTTDSLTIGTLTGILKGTTGAVSVASAGTDYQAPLTFGIADTNKVQINAADVADNDYAKFTATGLEGRSYSEVLSDIGAQPAGSYEAPLTFGNGLTRTVNAVANDLITGIAGGQTIIGGTATGENLLLQSTSHATKGLIALGSLTTGLLHNELNSYTGAGTATPNAKLEVLSTTEQIRASYSAAVYTSQTTDSSGYYNLTSTGGRANLYLDIATDQYLNSDTNTFLGVNVAGSGNLAHSTGNEGWYNVAIGLDAFVSVTTGSQNVAVGNNALRSNTTGIQNQAIGANALYANVDGSYNMAFGIAALRFNIGGDFNVAVGPIALYQNTTGDANVGVGYFAGRWNETGNYNVSVGREALEGVSGNSYTGNVSIGHQSTTVITTGNYNVVAGYRAGYVLTEGNNNILLGYQAGDNITTGSSNIIIGDNVNAPVATGSNQLNIGNTIYGDLSTGYIGIGTATPATKLYIAATATQLTLAYTSGVTGTLGVNSSGYLNINTTGGRVGIGTATPTARLHLPAGTAAAGTSPLKFTSGTALTTPESGAIEYHDSRIWITNKSSRKAIDRTSDVKIDTTTITDTTTETTVFTGLVPANSMVAGNILKLEMFGTIDEAAAADEVTIRVKIGTTTMATILSPASGVTAKCWHIKGSAILRTAGASGSMAWHIDMDAAGNSNDVCGIDTIDTTASENVIITAEWNNAKAGNIFTCTGGFLEYKN